MKALHTPAASARTLQLIQSGAIYLVLTLFAGVMLFPFLYMLFTSFKTPADTFRYPPRLLPREGLSVSVAGFDTPLSLYRLATVVNHDVDGENRTYALVEDNIRLGRYADPAAPEVIYERTFHEVSPTGGFVNQQTIELNGETYKLFDVVVDGVTQPMIQLSEENLGRFIDPAAPEVELLLPMSAARPLEALTWQPENYTRVIELNNMGRALTNTTLVTLLVVVGQLITSVVGGYAFARLQFPGRDTIFVFYLGTIMIPFVMLIIPLYQLMVFIGWVDRLAALVVPWIFTAYGTFLMRQFFITLPKEVEEAALMDGATRLQILWRIFIPASVPALATQATFTFLYAWNSFFWPLVIINTGNERNHVLTLALNVLRGRASDAPNLILAGAAISILPPLVVFILGQRFFVESVTSSAVKG